MASAGGAVVFEAPTAPASKDQCMNGGWWNYPQFKNQGDCVSFAETGKQTPWTQEILRAVRPGRQTPGASKHPPGQSSLVT